jgi:hypothetical protein
MSKNIQETMLEILRNELIETLYIKGIEFNTDTIVTVIGIAMEVVELHNFDGLSKRNFVINLIKKLNNDLITDEKQQLLNKLFETGIIESTIDIIVLASKNKLQLNLLEKEGKEVLKKVGNSCFTSCLSGKNKQKLNKIYAK